MYCSYFYISLKIANSIFDGMQDFCSARLYFASSNFRQAIHI